MVLKRYKLQDIDLDKIDSLGIQPEQRTEEKRLKGLRGSIENTRAIAPPEVTPSSSGRYTASDGHRRIAVARSLGFSRIQCLILDEENLEEHFFTSNCYTEQVSSVDRFTAYAKTPRSKKPTVLAAMKPRQAKQIRDLESILGIEEVEALALEGHPLSSVARCVRCVLSWCDARGYTKPTPRRIARWLVKHKGLRLVDSIARNNTPKATEGIVNAILENRAFKGQKR